jgi:hypothetical protein
MKKILVFMVLLGLALIFSSGSVLAGGDQLIGENAEGPAYMLGETPFTGVN